MAQVRLAILTSHPVQYQAPLFRLLAQHPAIDLTVLFCERVGAVEWTDPGFGVAVKWDVPLLEGYRHRFMRNLAPKPSVNDFFGLVNPGVVRILRDRPPDALLVYGYVHCTNWLAVGAARALRIPLLLRGESTLQRRSSGLRRILKPAVLRALFAQVAAFCSIGTLSEEFYRYYGVPGQKLFRTPYAVDNEMFFAQAAALDPSRAEIRRELGISPDQMLVLFSGKLISRKRPLDPLRALEWPQLRQVIIGYMGDGELRPALEDAARRLAPERVRVFGFKNQQEMAPYYVAADAFVLPSEFETWGLVLNEAMCFGLPVLATTQVGASRDLIRHAWNGFVYPPGDIRALGEGLAALAADPQRREMMGQRSRALIATWNNEACVAGVLAAVEFARAAPRGR